ncbi:MAG: hypothetical protein O2826_02630 [Chloroflexi bacterium]|nr:hypothetical protein [Chloroflexota bacterium]MDA1173395.1 hypothetical protein [Chloroflexota bacterium]
MAQSGQNALLTKIAMRANPLLPVDQFSLARDSEKFDEWDIVKADTVGYA